MGVINDIHEDRNGTIWLSRSNLDDDKGSLCEVVGTKLRCHGKSEGVPPLDDGPLLCDAWGNVWIGGSSMLTRWKPGLSSTYAIKGLESGGDFSGVQALANAPDGSLMVGMTQSGPTLGLQQLVDGVWKPFVVPGLDGRNLAIAALFLDREKALWIGTSAEGVYRIYDGTVDHFRGADGLTGEAVYSFYEDNEGDVWAVTSGGLDRFRDFQVTSFSTREGLQADGVQTVLASRNGTVWVGNFATLDSLHDGRISSIGRKDGLPGEHPSSLFEDHAGRLWVGVDSELSVYEKGKFTPIRRPDGSPVGRAVALAEDKDGDLWIESYAPPRGLLRIRDFKVLDELRPPGMPYAASLAADPEGGIWLGLVNGDLARHRNGQLTTYNFDLGQSDSRVRRVEVRPDGTVLGATPSGVIGWHDGKKQILSSRNGLPCDFIYTLISDKTSTLWLYTQCGLVAVASDELQRWWDHPETTLKVRTFDVFDGAQPAIVFNQPAASLSPDGRLWFANGTVLQMVDPAHIGGNSVPPPVHIEEVTADRKRYQPVEGLGLPPSTRDLEIDYTALSFVVPQKVHFQYKLEGYDRDWQDAGTRRQAFYSNLPPRNYTFRVKACNNSGVWNEAGASLDFFVAPAFYETVWFRSLGGFLFLAVLIGLYRLRVRHLERQRDALRKSEKELRDVIDTIPALVWSALPDGSNTYVNKRFVEYTGSSAEQMAGSGWQALVHPDDLERHAAKWIEAVATGKPHESEVRSRRSDGQYRWQLDRGLPLRDEDGNIVKWYGITTDIEDRKRAEEALQQNQFYLAEGQRLAHMGSWAFDATGFSYWSSELFQVYGLDPRGKPPTVEEYLALVHPEDRAFMKQGIAKMLDDHLAFDFTKRIMRSDGEIRHVRCVGIPVTQGGIFQGFLGTGMDVTEHELLTQELRRREAYLADAQRLSQTGSFGWRPDSGEIVWSDETYRIFEYDHAVKLTMDLVVQRVHPDDRPGFLKVIESASAGATQFEHTYRLLLPDGSVKHVHALAHALQDASGNREFVGAATDVTSIKRAEEELRKSEAYLAEAQRLSQTGSWAWSPDQDIGYWSEECYRVLSFDPQDGLPRFEDFFQRLHPDDQPGFKELIQTAIREKAEWEADYRIVHPDGPVRDIHVVGHPVLSTSGHLVEFVGTVIDVTERRRAEQERERLRQLEADLAHTNRVSTLGEMAASLAHEIKQPIAAAIISANATLRWLKRDQPDVERACDATTRIVKDGTRAADIIDRLRSFYKKSPPQRELVDVNGLIQEMLTLLKGEADRYSIAMRTDLAAELPKIMADRVQVQQVLMNLMLNGIEAMKEMGGVLTVKSELDQDGRVRISVSDAGVGLPAEKADEIFNAFFTTKPQGSGMGLAISRTIIDSHGGRLWATANDGRGATFLFTLPTAAEAREPAAGT